MDPNDVYAFLHTFRKTKGVRASAARRQQTEETKSSNNSTNNRSRTSDGDGMYLPPPLPAPLAGSFRPHNIFSSSLFLGALPECKVIAHLHRDMMRETSRVLAAAAKQQKQQQQQRQQAPPQTDANAHTRGVTAEEDSDVSASAAGGSITRGVCTASGEDRPQSPPQAAAAAAMAVVPFLIVSALSCQPWKTAQLQLRQVRLRRPIATGEAAAGGTAAEGQGRGNEEEETVAAAATFSEKTTTPSEGTPEEEVAAAGRAAAEAVRESAVKTNTDRRNRNAMGSRKGTVDELLASIPLAEVTPYYRAAGTDDTAGTATAAASVESETQVGNAPASRGATTEVTTSAALHYDDCDDGHGGDGGGEETKVTQGNSNESHTRRSILHSSNSSGNSGSGNSSSNKYSSTGDQEEGIRVYAPGRGDILSDKNLCSAGGVISREEWARETRRLRDFLIATCGAATDSGEAHWKEHVAGGGEAQARRTSQDTADEDDVDDDSGGSGSDSSGGPILFRYYRLCLPIEDDEWFPITPFLLPTALLVRAALGIERVPAGAAGAAADRGRRRGESAQQRSGGGTPEGTGREQPLVRPGVVVHCQAGRSRSATLVAAALFLIALFCSPAAAESAQGLGSDGVVVVTATRAREVVDAILQYIREVRCFVEPNLGFYQQLQAWAAAYLASVSGD